MYNTARWTCSAERIPGTAFRTAVAVIETPLARKHGHVHAHTPQHAHPVLFFYRVETFISGNKLLVYAPCEEVALPTRAVKARLRVFSARSQHFIRHPRGTFVFFVSTVTQLPSSTTCKGCSGSIFCLFQTPDRKACSQLGFTHPALMVSNWSALALRRFPILAETFLSRVCFCRRLGE